MTDQEIRIAVAELDGWTNIGEYSPTGDIVALGGTPPENKKPRFIFPAQRLAVPDYPNDANAVIPLLEKWAEGFGMDYDAQQKVYGVTLCSFAIDAIYASAPTFARAACVALLKAHRKWVD